ncbi:hypothetical protein ACIQTW_21480 [Paenarthrobacter sp. NPDC090517]|uniref:hypothetical protein n=1 Tax=Paenarthrobacter sp. NPDC090517 TaxID=3364381 RepID=UPI003815C7EB
MTPQWLRDNGFHGFIRFDAIRVEKVPTEHGVYAVIREGFDEPQFVTPGTGRKGSHYPLGMLQDAWIPEAAVLYFGKAQCKQGVFERLNKYRRFGDGKSSGHSGGRAIWQLEDAQDLKVCWLVTQDRDPQIEESRLIEAFKELYGGRRPFANRIGGKKGDE